MRVAESFESVFKWCISSSFIHLVLFQRKVRRFHRDNIAFLGSPLFLFGFSEFMIHESFRIKWLKVFRCCHIKLVLYSFDLILFVNDYFWWQFLLHSLSIPEVASSCTGWLVDSVFNPFLLCSTFKDSIMTANSTPIKIKLKFSCPYFVVLKAMNSYRLTSQDFFRSLN